MGMASDEMQEDKIGHIGWEIADSVPLVGIATAELMAPYPSPTDRGPFDKILET